MRAGGCQCLGTSRHALEFSREFGRQKPAERCEVAFFYGITACHPSVTLVTHEKGANALYIGVLSPCHPFSRKILYRSSDFKTLDPHSKDRVFKKYSFFGNVNQLTVA